MRKRCLVRTTHVWDEVGINQSKAYEFDAIASGSYDQIPWQGWTVSGCFATTGIAASSGFCLNHWSESWLVDMQNTICYYQERGW